MVTRKGSVGSAGSQDVTAKGPVRLFFWGGPQRHGRHKGQVSDVTRACDRTEKRCARVIDGITNARTKDLADQILEQAAGPCRRPDPSTRPFDEEMLRKHHGKAFGAPRAGRAEMGENTDTRKRARSFGLRSAPDAGQTLAARN